MLKKASYLVMTVFMLTFVFSLTVLAGTTKTAPKPAPKITETEIKIGVVKNYDSNFVTVLENGKTLTYKITDQTKVYNLGNLVDILEVIKKGLKVRYKVLLKDNVPQYLTYLDIPPAGIEGRGVLGVTANDIRQNDTDDPTPPATTAPKLDTRTNLVNGSIATVADKQPIEENSFIFVNKKRINLGQIEVIFDSIVLSVNGKPIKLIKSDQNFDTTVPDDEAKLVKDKNNYYIDFEKEISDKAVTEEDADKIITISYKKKIYQIDTVEFNSFPVHEDVYVELNGKETTLQRALYRGTYAYIVTNLDGEIIYVDSFYNDVEAQINSIDFKNKTMNITVLKYGKSAFKDVVKVSDSVVVYDEQGEVMDFMALYKNNKIRFSVDPLEGYKVITINRLSR